MPKLAPGNARIQTAMTQSPMEKLRTQLLRKFSVQKDNHFEEEWILQQVLYAGFVTEKEVKQRLHYRRV